MHGKQRNYKSLPFPLRLSSCQQLDVTGPQTTRDRPFTIAELLMKSNAEQALNGCLQPSGACASLTRYASVFVEAISAVTLRPLAEQSLPGGNCSIICPSYYECVEAALNDANTSHARRREHKHACLHTPAGEQCTARTPDVFTEDSSPAALEKKSRTGKARAHARHRTASRISYTCPHERSDAASANSPGDSVPLPATAWLTCRGAPATVRAEHMDPQRPRRHMLRLQLLAMRRARVQCVLQLCDRMHARLVECRLLGLLVHVRAHVASTPPSLVQPRWHTRPRARGSWPCVLRFAATRTHMHSSSRYASAYGRCERGDQTLWTCQRGCVRPRTKAACCRCPWL